MGQLTKLVDFQGFVSQQERLFRAKSLLKTIRVLENLQ
jgi:hypothetical protein